MATAAPPRTRAADLNIPPPPLPEFYLPNNSDEQEVDKETVMKVRRYTAETKEDDFAQRRVQLPSEATKATDKTMTRVTYADHVRFGRVLTMPPLAGGAADVPPLAIYHICRLCLRPRSARYHREHPIPVNGVPPPPGICRRCRFMSIEEVSKVAETTKCGESNKIRIGLGCIVQDDDLFSNQEYRNSHNGQKFMPPLEHLDLRRDSSSGRSRETREEHKKLPYRYVRVRESSISSPPPRPRTHAESTAQDVIDAVSVKSATALQVEDSTGEAAHGGFRGVGEGQITARLAKDNPSSKTQLATYAASSSSRTSLGGPAGKTGARASAAVSVQQPVQPQWSETGIRRLARDEVQRYRQAERKLEAHHDPYAHGRMVPIERRIERTPAEAVELSWKQKKNESVEEIIMVKKQSSQRQPQPSPAQRPAPEPRQPHRRNPPSESLMNYAIVQSKESTTPENTFAWVDEEVVIEGLGQQSTHATKSGYLPRYGQDSDTAKPQHRPNTNKPKPVDEKSPGRWNETDSSDRRASRPGESKASDSAEPRSDRSERRKWDLMSDLDMQTKPEAGRVQARDRRRAERDSYIRREIWLPPGKDYEIIEIIENYGDGDVAANSITRDGREVAPEPDDPRGTSVDTHKAAPAKSAGSAKDVSGRAKEQEQSVSRPDPSANCDRSTGRTGEEPGSRWRKREVQDREPRRGPTSLSSLGIMARSARVVDDDDEKSRQEEDAPQKSRPRAFDLRWAAANANAVPRRDRDELEGDEKTMHLNAEGSSTSQAKEVPSASGLSGRNRNEIEDDGKTMHPSSSYDAQAQRVNSSASRPAWRPNEHAAASSHTRSKELTAEQEYIYTERIVEPADTRPQRVARGDAGRHYTRIEEIWRKSNGSKASSRGVPAVRSNAPTSSTAKAKQPSQKTAGDSEHSSRVHFNPKVDISPTPPGSDANSEDFRLIGGSASSKARLRDSESGEDLIAEFERRGRSKVRESRSLHSGAGEQEYFYERKETVRAPSNCDGGWDDAPAPAAWEGGSSKSQRKPLAEAYSENPTRERSTRCEGEGSGAGPYRPELVPGGSEHTSRAEVDGGAEDARSGHAHGRWPEDSPVKP